MTTHDDMAITVDAHEETFVRIAGVLYGQAYGDAFGMPSELLRRDQIKPMFGTIDSLLAGHPKNPASCMFEAGEFTDDTQQALAILHAVIECDGKIDANCIAKHILTWADERKVWDQNILGPSSKAALTALRAGTPISELENQGTTNGAAMRSAVLGCILSAPLLIDGEIDADSQLAFIEQVYEACSPTHKSDVAVAGAVMIACFIACVLDGMQANTALSVACETSERAQNHYASTLSPLVATRVLWAINLLAMSHRAHGERLQALRENLGSEGEEFERALATLEEDYHFEICELTYTLIGADMETIHTVPAAFALAEASNWNPSTCARLAANLGGDTDTIGAIACALCGAIRGVNAINSDERALIDSANGCDLFADARILTELRERVLG